MHRKTTCKILYLKIVYLHATQYCQSRKIEGSLLGNFTERDFNFVFVKQ